MNQWLDEIVASAVIAAVFLIGYLLVARLGFRFVRRYGETGNRAATLWSMLRRVLVVAICIVALLTILSGVWGLPITPLLGVASVIGVALGFGAQKLVQDVIAGFFILLEDQFRIGSLVSIAGVTGEVADVRLRVTVLRGGDGSIHYVPNGEVKVATNLTNSRLEPPTESPRP